MPQGHYRLAAILFDRYALRFAPTVIPPRSRGPPGKRTLTQPEKLPPLLAYALACAKLSATCAQLTVFHHASMYSGRRF